MQKLVAIGLSLALTALGAGRVSASEPQVDAGTESIHLRLGKYTFWIDARNRSFQSIQNARATGYLSGDRMAQITVSSDGYREARETVWLNPNSTTYNVRATLDDPTVWVDVYERGGSSLQHSSRIDSFGVWGDEFRFVSRISAEGFARFTAHDVQVRVGGMIPFGDRVRVSTSGTQREIEITVKRRDMNSYSNSFRVYVPSDETLGPPPSDAPASGEADDARTRYRRQAFAELEGGLSD